MENTETKNEMPSLKKTRENLGLTLKEVAEKTNIEEAYLKRLEDDEITHPSVNTLWKLSNLYKIPLKDLLTEWQLIKKKQKQ
jgi:transcriptional regulator with XRE-family HTH domain